MCKAVRPGGTNSQTTFRSTEPEAEPKEERRQAPEGTYGMEGPRSFLVARLMRDAIPIKKRTITKHIKTMGKVSIVESKRW